MAFYAPPSSRLVDLLTQQGQERAALAQARAGQLRQTFADIAQPVQATLSGLIQEQRDAPLRALKLADAVQGLQDGQLKLGAEQERIARAKATQAVLGTPGVFNPQDGSIDLDKAATAAQAFGPVGMAILPELQQAELGRRKTAAETESAQATAAYRRSQANKPPEVKLPTEASLAADSVDPTKTPEQRTAAASALAALRKPETPGYEWVKVPGSTAPIQVKKGEAPAGAVPYQPPAQDTESITLIGPNGEQRVARGAAEANMWMGKGWKKYSESAAKPQSEGPSPYTVERVQRTRDSVKELLGTRQKDGSYKGGMVNGWTTGYGSLLSSLPATDARNFKGKLDTLKSNIAFNELTQMREASKTGGALGSIAVRELELLESSLGALDAAQADYQFRKELEKVDASLARWQEAQAAAQPRVTPGTATVIPGRGARPKANPFR
jgi:hypothetical protein